MAPDSSQLARSFAERGVAIVPGFVEADWIVQLRKQAEDLVSAFEPGAERAIFSSDEQRRNSDRYFLDSGDKVRFFFEPEAFLPDGSLRQKKELSINKIGHALHKLDPLFRAFSQAHPVEPLARTVGQREPFLLQSMYIFKQPNIGGEVGLHQDNCFLYTEPPSTIGFWLALETAHRENGCLWAIPGGHTGPLRQRFFREGDGTAFSTLDQTPYDMAALIPLEVEAGTLIILHGNLPHQSGANRSASSRHAYILHTVDMRCTYPIDNWLQPGPMS